MCAVSMIHDYMRNRVPRERWTRDSFHDFKEILRRLDALDRKLEEPDCHDPSKAEWMKEVEQRLAKRRKSSGS